MKCPHCKTYVTKIQVNWKCPYCGKKLPEPGKWFMFYESLTEYLQYKGAIFWGIWLGLLLLLVGVLEAVFGHAFLISYIGNSMIMSIIGIAFGGMLIDMYMKVNLPLRLQYGTDFIIRERAIIRNIRKGTNLAALAGIVCCLIWLKPRTFLEYFPAYLVVIGWFLAMSWAITGLFLDARMADDVRFRHYMDRLGITSLKRYRRTGTIVIGSLVVIAVGYNFLIRIPELWIKFSNLGVVGVVVNFIKMYLAWLF